MSEIALTGPAAGPEWRLRHLGFTLTKFELFKKQHAMAVPPGENGWLKRLTEFVDPRRSSVPSLLQANEVRS